MYSHGFNPRTWHPSNSFLWHHSDLGLQFRPILPSIIRLKKWPQFQLLNTIHHDPGVVIFSQKLSVYETIGGGLYFTIMQFTNYTKAWNIERQSLSILPMMHFDAIAIKTEKLDTWKQQTVWKIHCSLHSHISGAINKRGVELRQTWRCAWCRFTDTLTWASDGVWSRCFVTPTMAIIQGLVNHLTWDNIYICIETK